MGATVIGGSLLRLSLTFLLSSEFIPTWLLKEAQTARFNERELSLLFIKHFLLCLFAKVRIPWFGKSHSIGAGKITYKWKSQVETVTLRSGSEKIGLESVASQLNRHLTLRSFSKEDVTQKIRPTILQLEQIDQRKIQKWKFLCGACIYGFRPETFIVMKRLGQLTEIFGNWRLKWVVENTLQESHQLIIRLVLEFATLRSIDRIP